MKIIEKSINLEVLLSSSEILKIVSDTEYFFVICKDGKLIIKEEI